METADFRQHSRSTRQVSRDGHWMFFASNRPGGFEDSDILVSYRTPTHDDFGWQLPLNLGANINTAFFDAGPTFFRE
jgi:hypothetical protein